MARRKSEPFKLYNKRVVPLVAVFFILGIYTVKVSAAVGAITFACAAVFLFLLVRAKSLTAREAIVLAAFAILGFALAFSSFTLYNEYGLKGVKEIRCRVTEVSVKEDTENEGELLYSVVADSITCNGKRESGKISFRTAREMAVGDRVAVTGKIRIRKLSLDSVFSAMQYRVGAKYAMDDPFVESRENGRAPLSYSIRRKTLEVLTRSEGDRAGSFTYAMLFGDSSEMQKEDKTAMRAIGVAHVFAVSGLHVGVLSAAILFLLKKLRAKNWVLFFSMLPILGFYAYVCGFTPSVLRASIMVLLSLAANALGMRYDGLSSVSFAAIAILLFKPLYLFDLSFILSFLSVLGILSLSRPLERIFLRHKMRRSLAQSLAVSLATSIAIAPVSAVAFGKITFMGIVMNLVVVPLASVTYVASLVSVLLTFVYSGFGALFEVVRFLPLFIAELSVRASELGKPQSYVFSAVEIAVYYAALLFAGNYSLASRKTKLIAAGSVACVMLALILA